MSLKSWFDKVRRLFGGWTPVPVPVQPPPPPPSPPQQTFILAPPALGGRAIVGQRVFGLAGAYSPTPDSIATSWQYADGTILSDAGDNHLNLNIEEGKKLKFIEVADFGILGTLTNPSVLSAAIAARTLGPVTLSRTSALSASPLAYAITLPTDCYPGDMIEAQTAADSTYGDILQRVPIALDASTIADPTLLPAAFTAAGLVDPGATELMRVVLTAHLDDDTVFSSVSGNIGKAETFNPGSLSDLAVWYSAKAGNRFKTTDHSTVANNGDSIGCLSDRSSGFNDVTQATSGNRPLAVDSSGKSWADFDGVNDILGNGNPLPLTNVYGEWTAFAAVKFDDVSSYQIVVDADSASGRLAQFIRMTNAGKIETIAFRTNDVPVFATGAGARSTNAWYDVVVVCSTITLRIFVNGVLDATVSTVGLSLQNIAHAFAIGGNNIASPTSFLNGQIAEAGVRAGASSDPEVASLTTYLASTHP